MPTPTLSIIMPVYNAEAYVEEAVRSILSQTFTDFELIVVDDGSTDRSMLLVRQFADKRIRIVVNDTNRGIVFSRNLGMQHAHGRYIAPFDADDMAHPRKFERQVAFLERHPVFGMVGSWARLIDAQGRLMKKRWRLSAPPERIPPIMLFRNYFVQSAVVIRREAIPRGGYKEGFNTVEDYLMWAEVARHYKVWNLPEYLISYRLHAQGVTSREAAQMPSREARVFKEVFKSLQISIDEEVCRILQPLKDDRAINGNDALHKTEAFLLHVIRQNARLGVHDQRQLIRVGMDRWLKACTLSGRPLYRWLMCFLRSALLSLLFKSEANHLFGITKQANNK